MEILNFLRNLFSRKYDLPHEYHENKSLGELNRFTVATVNKEHDCENKVIYSIKKEFLQISKYDPNWFFCTSNL